MSTFLDSVKNGFATASTAVNEFFNEKRSTNTDRPRVQSQDPTQAIDRSEAVEILSFPIDRPKYYITFGFKEYSRPNQFEGLHVGDYTDYICLPMPNNLVDGNHFNYSPIAGSFAVEALSAIGHAVAPAITKSIATGSVDPMVDGGKSALAALGNGAIGAGVRGAVGVARTAESVLMGGKGQSTVDGLLQMGGLADNPFNTIAFSGPDFKTHSFVWMMSPKSPSESRAIKLICDTFKKAAHPELLTMAAGGFFKYPNIVMPKFQPDKAKDSLYDFKPCVITALNINFTPTDRPGFFAGTEAPIQIVLELQLQEIELWRNGDNKQLADHYVPTIDSKDFKGVQGAPLGSSQPRYVD